MTDTMNAQDLPMHSPSPKLRVSHAYALMLVAWVCSGGQMLILGWQGTTTPISWAGTAFALALTVLVVLAQGASARDTVGICPRWAPRGSSRSQQWWNSFLWAIVAAGLTPVLYFLVRVTTPATTFPTVEFALAAPLQPLVMAVVAVILLGAAQRPLWEVHTAASLASVSALLIPFGVSSLVVVPATVCLVWVYHHARRLTPLVLGQALTLLGVLVMARS